ncbi:MAG: MFS transporter [Chloroflexi bacterium]|nr:MFS transporter [Chloroflexota bacterium]
MAGLKVDEGAVTAPTGNGAAGAGSPQPTAYHDLPTYRLYATMAGLMVTLLLAALDQTIVGTAMPRIVAELHGFEQYAWVTTAYLLTSTATVPIIGKLSDTYGQKPFLLGGTAFFILTSILCGFAGDMTQLIVYRGLQGIGGGLLMSIVFTVASALFPPAKRGKIQGMFSAVFGLSSIAGPLLGGYLTDNLSWRWVFYVNVPVGFLALAVLWFAFPDIRPNRRRPAIDYLGAVTLVTGIVPFLLALTWGGREYAWTSVTTLGLLGFSFVVLALFLWIESRAAEPIIPLGLFAHPIIGVSVLAMGIMATGMFGSILFVPLFIQAVIGTNATQSGTVLTPMMLAMVTSSIVSGQIISRTGRYRLVGLAGLAFAALGMFLLSLMTTETTYGTVIRNMIVVGLGLGLTMPVFTIAPQNAVSLSQIGVVTSLLQFCRSIGATIGSALLGSMLVSRFAPALRAAMPPELLAAIPPDRLAQLQNPQALLNPEAAASVRQSLGQLGGPGFEALVGAIRTALAASLQDVFLVGAVSMLIGVAITLFLKEVPLKKSFAREEHPEGAAKPLAPIGE